MLPWFKELERRKQLGITDCKECMRGKTKLERQYMACGYEPRLDRTHLTIWQPPTGNDRVGYKGPELKTCAGFTVNLPEVGEAAYARAAAKLGALGSAFEERPTEELMSAVMIVDGQYGALEAWLMTPSADGGGGK